MLVRTTSLLAAIAALTLACADDKKPDVTGPVAVAAPASQPAAAPGPPAPPPPPMDQEVQRADEPHLKNVKQLTFAGENAEAYFSKDGKEFTFQSRGGDTGLACDQIFRMSDDGTNRRQVSVGNGRTTCSYIENDGSIIYASTHGHGPGCLEEADRSKGYVWKVYPEMDIWRADADGKNAKVLFQSDGYDAEATVCHKDGRIVFTSSKSGDLEVYTMDKDGKDVKQFTNTPGYDGGAFFSEDCSKIVWRASRPEGDDLAEYQALLKDHLVKPTKLEIFVADADGKNVVQVTKNGKANFAPYMHPDNKRVLYVSNKADPKGRDFDVYLVNIDGTGEERITMNPTFDGFPMWNADATKIIFASNRHGSKQGDTNLFIADWSDAAAPMAPVPVPVPVAPAPVPAAPSSRPAP